MGGEATEAQAGGYARVSTGLLGLDRIVDGLRYGDNVMWQVDGIDDYRAVVSPFVAQALRDGRRVVYLRFGHHEPIVAAEAGVETVELDPSIGFELFATAVRRLVTQRGPRTFYVFDCLSALLRAWNSDLVVMNFFRVTGPWLLAQDAVAYLALLRSRHSFPTIASIRASAQVLLDLYLIDGQTYVHPLKVVDRYSPTMYFPHRIRGDAAVSITSSGATARLFASLNRRIQKPDPWEVDVARARDALTGTGVERREARDRLIEMLIGNEGPMVDLCRRHLTLEGLLAVADREIGTGGIGGKAVGMLVARAILGAEPRFAERLEPHDSYFLGADLFYTYLIANGWWDLWSTHKTHDGYYSAAEELRDRIPSGKFPPAVREQFMSMLEYFGQSPIIVRSSSLLEDNYGNAFAGKYESVFCAGLGTPEERLAAFERAVLTVYASAVSRDALDYRANRGLVERDEQMAVLVQRVSGDHRGERFYPHAAGVANSSNLYVWDPETDPSAGMVRLVFGLGTRAVDRIYGDHARIVALDNPLRKSLVDPEHEAALSQRYVDVLDLVAGEQATVPASGIVGTEIDADWSLFASPDRPTIRRLREMGRRLRTTPMVIDFAGLLRGDFPSYLRGCLARLEQAYAYPVDIEFTLNVAEDGSWRMNLVQCRPLQTRGLGKSVRVPEPTPDSIIATRGDFMGGNVRLPLSYLVVVRPEAYLALGNQDRYRVARQIGRINAALRGRDFAFLGPGRWGTTTPSLGIPVTFGEICHASVLGEFTYSEGSFLPELSYGSHFFQDLVESGIFYVAIFEHRAGTQFNIGRVLDQPNRLLDLDASAPDLARVVHVALFDEPVELYSDVVAQRLVCR